jgi:hypothetical protein
MAYTVEADLAEARLAESEAFSRTHEAADHTAWMEAVDVWLAALGRVLQTRRRLSAERMASNHWLN